MNVFKTANLACLVVGAALWAAALPAAADAPAEPETVVLKAAHIFDSTGAALKDGGIVVVRGERIVAVGGSAPAGARVIDLGDATLLPGFIDAHTHLTMEFEKDHYHGFPTVRNVGADDFVDVGLKNAINVGITEGPRMLTAVHGIGSVGGRFDDY